MIRRLGPWSGVSGKDPISGDSSCTGCVLGVDWDDHERLIFPTVYVEDLEHKVRGDFSFPYLKDLNGEGGGKSVELAKGYFGWMIEPFFSLFLCGDGLITWRVF